MNTLVLGVGNVLLTDEAVGIRAVEELERRFSFPEEVELLDGGCSGIELLRYLEGREYLVIVDAVRSGKPPGTVVRVEGEDVPKRFMTKLSPHQLGIADLLASALLTGEMPPNLVCLGIEPESMEMHLGLTPAVEESLEKLVRVVVDELRSYGHEITPKKLTPEEEAATSRWV